MTSDLRLDKEARRRARDEALDRLAWLKDALMEAEEWEALGAVDAAMEALYGMRRV